MQLSEIINLLQARILVNDTNSNLNYLNAYATDLMSNVLANVGSKSILITALNNLQVIRTAEMIDISLIIFVQGKIPSKETLQLANTKGIIILSTEFSLFTACGILYSNGMSCGINYG